MSAAMGGAKRSARHEAALAYADSGLYVFPARVTIELDRDGEAKKKINTIVEWQKVATRDKVKIDFWWFGSWADASVAVATGPSGLAVVDCDGPDGLVEWQRICDSYGLSDDVPRYSTPGGGEHWWYQADPDFERTLPTRSKTIGEHIDSRGGWADSGSGFVIVPPSVDGRGAYEWITDAPTDVGNELTDVPETVYAIVEDRAARKHQERPEAPRVHEGDRRFTLAQAQEFCRPAIEALKAADKGDINDALNTAARTVAHFGGEFWSRKEAEERLLELQLRPWHDGDDRAARGTIDSAYKSQAEAYASGAVDEDGRAKGWYATYVEPSPFGDTESDDEDSNRFESDVRHEIRRLKIREEATRRLRAEKSAGRPGIAEGVINDLDAIEAPAMLMKSLIPELGVGFLGGRSGAYKSFLAVSWACCIGTGQAWLGREEFTVRRRLKTLYVAAEGAGGAAARMRAWEAYTGISRKDRVLLYPRPIQLNDEDRAEALSKYIAENQIEFMVIDTFRRSTSNGDDNSTTEMGVVFDAVARIRDDHACGALFIDHTGHAGERLRGASAKGDDADYVLIASYEGQGRGPNVPRSLTVQKLKDLESDATWPVGLTHVPGHFPVATIRDQEMDEAVANFGGRSEWWENAPDAPDGMTEKFRAAAKSGRGVAAALWIWKLLNALDTGEGNEQGLTLPSIRRMLNEIPGQDNSEATVRGAVKLLVDTEKAVREKDRIHLRS